MKPPTRKLNLLGVACPLNWAKTKVALEEMRVGQTLEVTVDDPRAERDIPAAAEAGGHAVIDVRRVGRATRIVIER